MSIDSLAAFEREQEEKKDAEQSVAAYKRQLASLREKVASIDVEIEQYRAITANLRRGTFLALFLLNPTRDMHTTEKNKERSTLNAHAAYASPELKTCEHRLHCVVEGIEKDQLLVRFSHVDKSYLEREFSFVLDVSLRAYRGAWLRFVPSLVLDADVGCRWIVVLTSTPLLPTLPIYVEELNESRDLYAFIKQVRRAFEGLVLQGR
jgi:kinetochore protein Spc25